MFRLTPGRDVGGDVRAVAADRLDAMVDHLHGDEDDHETVHAVRKLCKKTRALVRLVRDADPDAYRHVNAALRDTARLISGTRDAAAAVETHDTLVASVEDDDVVDPSVREQLVARRDGQAADDVEARLPEVERRLTALRAHLDEWPLPDGDAVDVLRAGYTRTYRRARRRCQDATGDPDTVLWHQWRKRVKYHRHHVELLAAAWEPVMRQREQLLHELSDVLGEDHDIAELDSDLGTDAAFDLDRGVLDDYRALLRARRDELRRLALPLGARLFASPSRQHSDLVFAWWDTAAGAGDGATGSSVRRSP